MFKNDTFSRIGSYHQISASVYNLILGAVLLWGFALNWWMVATIPTETIKAINPLVFIIGYFASAIVGCIFIFSSKNPIISFFGYNMIVVPIGLVLVMFIPGHSQENIIAAVRVTTLLTVSMMVLGTLFPAFFKRIEAALFWALCITIVVELLQIFVFDVKLGVMDWIVAAIFCGYVGVDWGRANQIERTVDNAVDSAASLYLDIINLFVRVLEIISKK
ncbi:TPA: Bax inhibitor-1 family protein [Pseudomonas aeruginosa]|uniref:Histidine kinase n=1 Tax=Pseudomonas citronellolis TaxID=53408 RepID=A0A1A9KN26_9PSED|nr:MULTISPECIES: Bax inhibitor-1 family protein [Pseudomonas aeruginosa group]ANI18891.1 histidine kinase [Pseudomonas citronellolis]MCP9256499.1 Bax inhibitor-1 family protein [Pseudomonas aeruginosa]MCW8029813.1 Bax inhibitor-1 family protein [Pseudomonas aeruginosa]HEP8880253.1 US12 family protein [Pseudomonas aeruginosa]